MKRTQLYLDEDIWDVLNVRSRQAKTSISELVCQAVRDKYAGGAANRRRAMEAWAGLWKDRASLPDAETYVRRLRRGRRLKRILPLIAILIGSDVLLGVLLDHSTLGLRPGL